MISTPSHAKTLLFLSPSVLPRGRSPRSIFKGCFGGAGEHTDIPPTQLDDGADRYGEPNKKDRAPHKCVALCPYPSLAMTDHVVTVWRAVLPRTTVIRLEGTEAVPLSCSMRRSYTGKYRWVIYTHIYMGIFCSSPQPSRHQVSHSKGYLSINSSGRFFRITFSAA